MYDVVLLGISDRKSVFWQYMDLWSGDPVAGIGNLPFAVPEYFKTATGEPSVFAVFQKDWKKLSKNGKSMEGSQDPCL